MGLNTFVGRSRIEVELLHVKKVLAELTYDVIREDRVRAAEKIATMDLEISNCLEILSEMRERPPLAV